jgi:hypothetical protein
VDYAHTNSPKRNGIPGTLYPDFWQFILPDSWFNLGYWRDALSKASVLRNNLLRRILILLRLLSARYARKPTVCFDLQAK